MKKRIGIPTSVDIGTYGVEGVLPNCSVVSFPINTVYEKESDQSIYATQRKPLSQVVDASDDLSTSKGRGAHYWENTGSTYIVNNDKLYKDSYGTVLHTFTSGGYQKVTFHELGDYLVLLDAENNEGFYIDNLDVVTIISDVDFPPNQTPALELASGGAVLNNVLYVYCKDGTIWNSDINDPANWNALNFLTAERKQDTGLFLTSHRDHLVAVGTASIEFFYDAANPVGSPLRRRQDVFYNIGGYDISSWCNTGDEVYFLGSPQGGTPAVYQIKDFRAEQVSPSTLNGLLSGKLITEKAVGFMSSATLDGHDFVFVTLANIIDTQYSPEVTYVYDATVDNWSLWFTFIDPGQTMPIVDYSKRSRDDIIQNVALFANGDILRFVDRKETYDSIDELGYVDVNYVEAQDAYVYEGGQVNFFGQWMGAVLPEFDGGVMNNKFMHKLEFIGSFVGDTDATQDVDVVRVGWYDDGYRTLKPESLRTLELYKRRKMTRLGYFNRRAFFFLYTGHARIRFEGIEVDYDISDYA